MRVFRALARCYARWAGVILALAMLAGPASAQAPEPRPEPTAADKETARRLMDLGDERAAAGNYDGALEAYQGADAIMAVPTTGLEVGRTQARLGLLLEARDTLLRVSRYPSEPGEPPPFTRAREAAAKLAVEIKARIPSLRVQVTGLPGDTPMRVAIDGGELPAATVSLPRSVNPGMHVITVIAEGFPEAEQAVDVKEQEYRVIEINLQQPPAKPPGKPPEPVPLPAPPPVKPPEPVPPPPPKPPSVEVEVVRPAGTSPWVYIGFGVGGAGLVLGAITGAMSATIAADLKDQCPNDVCPNDPNLRDDRDRAIVLANTANVGFAVGGVGVAVGIIALALSGGDEEPSSDNSAVRLRPIVGPGALALEGSF